MNIIPWGQVGSWAAPVFPPTGDVLWINDAVVDIAGSLGAGSELNAGNVFTGPRLDVYASVSAASVGTYVVISNGTYPLSTELTVITSQFSGLVNEITVTTNAISTTSIFQVTDTNELTLLENDYFIPQIIIDNVTGNIGGQAEADIQATITALGYLDSAYVYVTGTDNPDDAPIVTGSVVAGVFTVTPPISSGTGGVTFHEIISDIIN